MSIYILPWCHLLLVGKKKLKITFFAVVSRELFIIKITQTQNNAKMKNCSCRNTHQLLKCQGLSVAIWEF